MMWMRCWYCCCWRSCGTDREKKKLTALDDSCSLILQDGQSANAAQAFCVPRRHSSFQPSTHNPVLTQPGRTHSDCSSSSDDEAAPEQKRGRCWSTIPASDVTELMVSRRAYADHNRSVLPNSEVPPAGKFFFDRHVLGEIAESEQGQESKKPPKVDTEIYGHISFTTCYNVQEQRLTVFLKQAEGLPRKGEEPYGTFVKMSLSSSSGKNFCLSRAVKRNLSPIYREEHVFHTARSTWKSTHPAPYLRLSLFDSERQGRHDALGYALLSLEDVGPEKKEHRLPLTPMSMPVKNLGQVLVGLHYTPTQSRLAIHVIKARHLHIDPEAHKRHLRPIHRDTIDTFCKVTLTCGGQKVKTCRSQAHGGPDPFFDFRTNFVVPPQYLRDTGTIVSLVVRSTLGRQGTTLGRTVAFGPYLETGDGNATHWGRMLQEGRSIVQWRNIYL